MREPSGIPGWLDPMTIGCLSRTIAKRGRRSRWVVRPSDCALRNAVQTFHSPLDIDIGVEPLLARPRPDIFHGHRQHAGGKFEGRNNDAVCMLKLGAGISPDGGVD